MNDGFKKGGMLLPVIENKIYSGPLLEHLEERADKDLANVGVAVADTASEAAEPADLTNLHLVLVVGLDLCELILNILGADRLSTDTSQRISSLVKLLLLNKETRRFWKESESNSEDQGPGELDTDRNAIGSGIVAVLHSVGDDGCKHQTNGDGKLVARNNGATNTLWSDLGHVQDVDGRNESNTNTCNQTTDNELWDSHSRDLDDDTNGEYTATSNDGSTTTDPVGKSTREDGTEERTGGQDGNDERLVVRCELISGSMLDEVRGVRTKVVDEVVCAENTVDVSGVVTEQDTSKSSKGTHEVGPEGDRGLGALQSHWSHCGDV